MSTARLLFDSSASPSTREQLAEQGGVDPLGLVVLGPRASHEVEEMHDRRARLTGVADQGVSLGEPAHRDLTAIAADLLRGDGATLFCDVEQRLQEHAPLRTTLCETAGLIGARKRVENCLDRRDPPGVLARDRIDPPKDPHQVEEGLRDERVAELEREKLLVLEARARGLLGAHVMLCDTEVDPLVEHARRFLVRQRDDAPDEVAARHLVRS